MIKASYNELCISAIIEPPSWLSDTMCYTAKKRQLQDRQVLHKLLSHFMSPCHPFRRLTMAKMQLNVRVESKLIDEVKKSAEALDISLSDYIVLLLSNATAAEKERFEET